MLCQQNWKMCSISYLRLGRNKNEVVAKHQTNVDKWTSLLLKSILSSLASILKLTFISRKVVDTFGKLFLAEEWEEGNGDVMRAGSNQKLAASDQCTEGKQSTIKASC